MKSPATAGDTAAAATVSVTAAVGALDSVAVTVETPPFSVIDVGDRTSVGVLGVLSGTHWPKTTLLGLRYSIARTNPPLSIMAWVTLTFVVML